MCSKCDLALAHTLLAEAELEAIGQEQQDRLSPSNATRLLFAHEHRARVHFADLEDLLEQAVFKAEGNIDKLHAMVREAILLALLGKSGNSVSPHEALGSIEALLAQQPEVVAAAVTVAVAGLAEVFEATYAGASGAVIGEASRQGVKALPAPPPTPAEALRLQAQAVAAHPWQRILGKVQAELSKPAVLLQDTITREDVQAVLDTVKIDGTRDMAKQAIHTAAGLGRLDTAQELEPQEIWASEIMDGAVCDECAKVDGRDYSSMEEAISDYPTGTYARCAGGARCRGTLVFVFAG